ncbi:winged helix-turn-helix domain-containing protein [Sphingobium nicotianae]|uniref:Response regulator transcription factor n=1 Tax=Sphingobium nicotianae TaxID=2782607 RepID=A0A9X1DDF2_9SPHN|nr:response regulator transcription factor [Sphingobium nicotianae]MBT2187882.1 response regulator transcription factor [Sphingobium nicotianae]
MARLLVIEDNERLAALIAEGLAGLGYRSDIAHSLADADAALAVAAFDVIVLDLGLPDGDGLDWLRARQPAGEPPALILTARGGLEDRVNGLDAGADDYLVKPFSVEELAARLRALLRRPGRRAEPVLKVGSIKYDSTSRSASVDDRPLDLARREADLLELLLRRAGQVVRRRSIEDALYRLDEAVTPNALEAIVSRLRRKLDDAGAVGQLHTVRGVGYLLREPDQAR